MLTASLSAALAAVGLREGFRLGWLHDTLWANVWDLLAYAVPATVVMLLGFTSALWPRVGLILHALAVVALVLFGVWVGVAPIVLAASLPLVALAALHGWGEPSPRRWAALVTVAVPLATVVAAGAGPALRIASRAPSDHGARQVLGRDVALIWVQAGPGWSRVGVDWSLALGVCRLLSEDGADVELDPVDAWRLPSVDEVVASMTRHGENAGGMWDPGAARASYEVNPDKEGPLWDVRSPIVTWWTASEVDSERAFTVDFDGTIKRRGKNNGNRTVGYRCVRSPPPSAR